MTTGMATPSLRMGKTPKLTSSRLRTSIGIEVFLLHLFVFVGPFLYITYMTPDVPEENPFRVKLVGALSAGETVGPPTRLRVTGETGPPVQQVEQPPQPTQPVRQVEQPTQPILPIRQVPQPTQPTLPVRQVAQPTQPTRRVEQPTQPVVTMTQRERIAAEARLKAEQRTAEARQRANEEARQRKIAEERQRKIAETRQRQAEQARQRKLAEDARKRAEAEARQRATQQAGGSNTNIAVPIGPSDQAQTYGRQNNVTPGGGAQGESQAYWDRLKRYIDTRWAEPPDSLLAGARPTVIILLTVAADGRVTAGRIRQSSGNRAMDESAQRLLANLDRVPAPQQGGYTIEMVLEIKK